MRERSLQARSICSTAAQAILSQGWMDELDRYSLTGRDQQEILVRESQITPRVAAGADLRSRYPSLAECQGLTKSANHGNKAIQNPVEASRHPRVSSRRRLNRKKECAMHENLVGRWAVCGKGRIGKIEGQHVLAWGRSWVGIGLDGRPWASRKPILLSAGDSDRLELALGGDVQAALIAREAHAARDVFRSSALATEE